MYQHRHFLFSLDFLIPLMILILGTIYFRLTDTDMAIQRLFFRSGEGWYLNPNPIVQVVYKYGNIPALLIAIFGVLLLARSFQNVHYQCYRKIGLFLCLAMVVGPGMIVNSILKDNWGRPRPREITEFNGKYEYEAILSRDPESTGKSFPCGHATMGFYLFVPWFILRKRYRLLAYSLLALGIGYGLLIGLIRMVQGGHFASDVLWAGVLVYLVAFSLFRLFRMHRDVYYEPRLPGKVRQTKSWLRHLIWILVPLLVLGVMLASPLNRRQVMALEDGQSETVSIQLRHGDLTIRHGEKNSIESSFSGFGFPGSRLKLMRMADSTSGVTNVFQNKKGFFTELSAHTYLILNDDPIKNLVAKVERGDINGYFESNAVTQSIHLEVLTGNAHIRFAKGFTPTILVSGSVSVHNNRPDIRIITDKSVIADTNAITILILDGKLTIE